MNYNFFNDHHRRRRPEAYINSVTSEWAIQDAAVHTPITTTPSLYIPIQQCIDTSLTTVAPVQFAVDLGAGSSIGNFQCPTSWDSTISCAGNSSALMNPLEHYLSTVPVSASTSLNRSYGHHLNANFAGQQSQSTLPLTHVHLNQTCDSRPKSPNYQNTPQLQLPRNAQQWTQNMIDEIMTMHGFRRGPGSTVNIPSASELSSLPSQTTGLPRGDNSSGPVPISQASSTIPSAPLLRALDLPPEVVIHDNDCNMNPDESEQTDQSVQSSSAKATEIWCCTCPYTLNFHRFIRLKICRTCPHTLNQCTYYHLPFG